VLKTRIITALILAPLAIGGLFFLPPVGFAVFTGAIICVGAWEWSNMAGLTRPAERLGYAALMGIVLAALSQVHAVALLWVALCWWVLCFILVRSYPDSSHYWRSRPVRALLGAFVLVPAWVGLNHLRTGTVEFGSVSSSLLPILYVFLIVWVADIGAYFAGRAFGTTKLAPRVSPGKSWAGVWGGLASVALLAVIAGFLVNATGMEVLFLILASLATGLVSVLGDLLESMFKRSRGIKDSSQLLPGHGGILDRIDSLTAAIPLFALLVTQLGWLQTGSL
jgi:phosphatidate cytidylyltransferase